MIDFDGKVAHLNRDEISELRNVCTCERSFWFVQDGPPPDCTCDMDHPVDLTQGAVIGGSMSRSFIEDIGIPRGVGIPAAIDGKMRGELFVSRTSMDGKIFGFYIELHGDCSDLQECGDGSC